MLAVYYGWFAVMLGGWVLGEMRVALAVGMFYGGLAMLLFEVKEHKEK